jgi:hypothetical protein
LASNPSGSVGINDFRVFSCSYFVPVSYWNINSSISCVDILPNRGCGLRPYIFCILQIILDYIKIGYFIQLLDISYIIETIFNFLSSVVENNTLYNAKFLSLFENLRPFGYGSVSHLAMEISDILFNGIVSKVFLNVFKNIDIIIIILVLLSIKVVRSNNVNTIFFYSTMLLFLNSFYLVINGLEPFVYFFIISEISALFIVYIITLSRKIRKKKTTQYLILFILPFLLFNKVINYNNFFFSNSSTSIYLNSFNDFKFIINQIFIKNKNIFLILFFITLISIIFVFIFRSKKVIGKSNSNLIKNNMHILNNFFLQKFKLF